MGLNLLRPMIAVIAVAGKPMGKKTGREEDRRKGMEITCWGRRRKGLIYNFTWAAGNQFLNAAHIQCDA